MISSTPIPTWVPLSTLPPLRQVRAGFVLRQISRSEHRALTERDLRQILCSSRDGQPRLLSQPMLDRALNDLARGHEIYWDETDSGEPLATIYP